MAAWTPLFSRIVESSIWMESDVVCKVFITMLAKKDKDHVCRGSAFNIAKWANKTEMEVIECIKVLCSPDTTRIEKQAFDGRRLQKVEDGWLVLNGEHYQRMADVQRKREYKKQKQSEYRRPGYQKKLQKQISSPPPDEGWVAPAMNGESTP